MDISKIRIIVVDDDKEQVDILQKILAKEGYSVETTTDPKDALQKINHGNYHIAIADIRMPEMDGIELLCEIKKSKPSVRVILITAFGDWGVYAKALGEGATDFLSKPFKIDDITASVKKVRESL